MCALCEAAYVQVPCSSNVSIEKKQSPKDVDTCCFRFKKKRIFSVHSDHYTSVNSDNKQDEDFIETNRG